MGKVTGLSLERGYREKVRADVRTQYLTAVQASKYYGVDPG